MVQEIKFFMPDSSTQKHYIGQFGEDGSVVKIEFSNQNARVYLGSGIMYGYNGIPFDYIESAEIMQPFKLSPEFVHIVLNNDRNVDDCIEGIFMYPDDAEDQIQSLIDQQVNPDSFSIKTVRIERKRIKQ